MSGFISNPPVLQEEEAKSPQRTTMSYEKTIVVRVAIVLHYNTYIVQSHYPVIDFV